MESKSEREAPAPTLGEQKLPGGGYFRDRGEGMLTLYSANGEWLYTAPEHCWRAALAERTEGSDVVPISERRWLALERVVQVYQRRGTIDDSGMVEAAREEFISDLHAINVTAEERFLPMSRAERAEPDGALREALELIANYTPRSHYEVEDESQYLKEVARRALASAPQRAGTEGEP